MYIYISVCVYVCVCVRMGVCVCVNYIIHSKTKKDNHQIPKIIRVPENKTNPKKRKEKFINNASNYYNKYRIHSFKACLKILCFR